MKNNNDIDEYKFSINLRDNKIGKFIKSLPLISISEKLKKGFKEEIILRDGLKIVMNEYKLKKNISVDFSIENAPLEFAFCLSGKMDIELDSETELADKIEIGGGSCSIFYLPNSSGQMRISGEDKLKILSLHVSPDYFKNFIDSDNSQLPKIIQQAIFNDKPLPFMLLSKMNAQMIICSNQILENIHSDYPRNMFLEAKSLELMTIILSEISNTNPVDFDYQPSEQEKQQIDQLIQYLEINIGSLPSLNELAKMAGMTHTRLNKVFRNITGETVFSYVRNKRLQEAKLQLENSQRMTDISYNLGFSSPAHLSRDFKEKFGISPKAYQKQVIGGRYETSGKKA